MSKYLFFLSSALLASPAMAQDDPLTPEVEPVEERQLPQVVPIDAERETIVVTATGDAEPIDQTGKAITVVARDEIDAVQGADIARVLERVPGIAINRNGGIGATTSLRIRGSDNDQVLTLIDGVRVADPSSIGNGYDVANLLPGNIERIEVLRGTNSTIWGSSAVGGVILVTTARPENGANLAAEIGSRDTYYVSGDAGFGGDRFGVSAYGSYFDTDGFSALAAGTEDDGFEQAAGGANVRFGASDSLTLRTSVRYADSTVEIDNFGDTLDTQDTEQLSGGAGADFTLGAADLSATYSFADTARLSTSAFGPFIADGRLDRADVRARVGLAAPVTLHAGGYYEWTSYTTNFGGDDALEGRGGYAQLEYASGGFHLAGGARIDDGTLFGSELSFGADASFTFARAARLRASYGEGYKAPSLYQLYDAFSGNAALQPEDSRNYDLGIEFGRTGGPALVMVTGFRRDIANQIDFDPATFVFFNTGKVRAQGIEIEAELRPSEALQVLAAYTYLDTDVRSGPDSGNDQGRRPNHALIVSADWAIPLAGLTVGGDVRLVGDSFDTNANAARLDGYQVVTLRAALPVAKRFALFGRVENLFDADYQTALGYNTPGRGVFGGVRARF